MAEPGSILERLRFEREQAMGEKFLTLEIPGWSGMLLAQYHPIPWADMTRLIKTASDDPQKGLDSNIDALIAACERLLVLEDGERKSLGDVLRAQGEKVQGEVRYNNGYAPDALGLDATATARGIVLEIFGAAVSPELAIGEHAAQITNWMTGVTQSIDEELVGK